MCLLFGVVVSVVINVTAVIIIGATIIEVINYQYSFVAIIIVIITTLYIIPAHHRLEILTNLFIINLPTILNKPSP